MMIYYMMLLVFVSMCLVINSEFKTTRKHSSRELQSIRAMRI